MPRKKKEKLLGGGMKANLLKEFIDLSYKGNTSIAPEGYSIDAPLSDSRVKVYTKNGSNDKDVIITHRGSVGLQDWWDNAKFLVAGKVKNTKSYKLHREKHLKAVEKYGAENIIGIGHSRAGLYLQELQKEVPIKEIITYNKAVGFYDALRENPAEQTDVKVKNDFVSLLSGLQKRPKPMVEIEATKNPLDFNKAHQPAEIEKLGDTFIGLEDKIEGGNIEEDPFITGLRDQFAEAERELIKEEQLKARLNREHKVVKEHIKNIERDMAHFGTNIPNYASYQNTLNGFRTQDNELNYKIDVVVDTINHFKKNRKKAIALLAKRGITVTQEEIEGGKLTNPFYTPLPIVAVDFVGRKTGLFGSGRAPNSKIKVKGGAINIDSVPRVSTHSFVKNIIINMNQNDVEKIKPSLLKAYIERYRTAPVHNHLELLFKRSNEWYQEKLDVRNMLTNVRFNIEENKKKIITNKANIKYLSGILRLSIDDDEKVNLTVQIQDLNKQIISLEKTNKEWLAELEAGVEQYDEILGAGFNKKQLTGSGTAPKSKTEAELKKLLTKLEKQREKIKNGKEYKTTNIDKVNYAISYTEARLLNYATKGTDLIITKKKKYGDEVPRKAKAYKAKGVKSEKEVKPEPPKIKRQKAFLLEYKKEPEPEPKPEPKPEPEPEPEPKKKEPKKEKPKKEPWSQSGICKKIMCAYGLRTKAQYKAWILKNHPDKGGTISNEDLVKIIDCANSKMYCKAKKPVIVEPEPPKPLRLIYKEEPKKEEPKIEMPEPEPTKQKIEPLVNKLEDKIKEFEEIGRKHGAVIYDSGAFIQIVAYIALLIEYEAKCAIVGNKDLSNYEISSNINSLKNDIFYSKAKVFSEDLLDCINRGDNLIAIPLSLNLEKENAGHANMLIYRPYNKTIERFEPHGQTIDSRKQYSKTYNNVLKRMFEVEMKPYLKEYTPKFISSEQVCPVLRGFQSLEASLKGGAEEGIGFCGMWSLFMLELIFINPTLPTSEIIKIALDISNKKPKYLKNVIRGYVLKVEKMLDNYIKKIDANDGFEFKTGKKIQRKITMLQEQLLNLLLSFNSENSKVKELKETVKFNKQKDIDTSAIKKFLLSKSIDDLTKMIKIIFKIDIGDGHAVEDIIIWLINTYLYEDKLNLGTFKRFGSQYKDHYIDDIYNYYNVKIGSGFNYLDEISDPINPIYKNISHSNIPSIVEPEDEFLLGGAFTDIAGMNCNKEDGSCFNPVWEKQKIKRQILSEYKIWYNPFAPPPAGTIRMAWLPKMIEERYKPLYDEFVARRNVNIGLPADASKDRFAQQMFSNLTDGLSYVPGSNLATIGLTAASALSDTKKGDGT